MGEHSVSLKLLIDTQSNRVLLAEAGKDCVDFLFYILSLPVARLISLIGKQGDMLGSLPNLYESLQNLNIGYIQANQTTDTLLKPVSPVTTFSVPLLTTEGIPYAAVEHESGFVKGGVVSYMVMDDLTVLPMPAVSSFDILNKYDVKDVGMLEEKLVSMGMLEAVKLVKASMETKNVLMSVFLNDLRSSTQPDQNESSEKKKDVVSEKTTSWFEITRNNSIMVEVNNYVNLQGAVRVEASSSISSPEEVWNDTNVSGSQKALSPVGPIPVSISSPEAVWNYSYVSESQRSSNRKTKCKSKKSNRLK